MPRFNVPESLEKVLASARASQRQEETLASALTRAEKKPKLCENTSATPAAVRAWLADLRLRKGPEGRQVANAQQYLAVEQVAARVMQELDAAAYDEQDFGEPFRWLLHGGPGTGKSHVIKLVRELFENVLGWDMSVQFQVVAFQAVMAQQLGGDTIHHACGIPVYKKGQTTDVVAASRMDVAKRVLQWRWLIIDEISMVSARLLAEMDVKLRDVVRDLDMQKKGEDNVTRPFCGLNVLCCGDFWQLAPRSSSGAPAGTCPRPL